jgi:hypothetical protein
MTYLSMLDDSQSELIGGGIFDITNILAINFTPLTKTYAVNQANNSANNVTSGQSFLGLPVVAASIQTSMSNIALLS